VLDPPQRWGSAAEIDRDQVVALELARSVVQLPCDRREIVVVRWLADLDREVAVRAQLAAPGKMEVDA